MLFLFCEQVHLGPRVLQTTPIITSQQDYDEEKTPLTQSMSAITQFLYISSAR